jgi:hypothetical protein
MASGLIDTIALLVTSHSSFDRSELPGEGLSLRDLVDEVNAM